MDNISTIPPCNIEAEEEVLGGILLDPEAIALLADTLNPEAFYVTAHQKIYKAAIRLYSRGMPTDLNFMSNELREMGVLDPIGGQVKLAQLLDRMVGTHNIKAYAQLIKEKYLGRQLIKVGNQIKALGTETHRALEERLESAEQLLFALTQEISEPSRMGRLHLREHLEKIRLEQTAGEWPAIPSGLPALDNYIVGFRESDLIVVGARSGIGKTNFATQMAMNAASYGGSVLCFSAEMGGGVFARRFLANKASINLQKLTTAQQLSPDEWKRFNQAQENLNRADVDIDDTYRPAVSYISAQIRRHAMERGNVLPALIIVDFLQLLAKASGKEQFTEISQIAYELKGIAREFRLPVIALAQLNRESEARGDKKPEVFDLAGSDGIQRASDAILLLHWVGKQTGNLSEFNIIVGKNRNGPSGEARVHYEPEYCRFSDRTPPSNRAVQFSSHRLAADEEVF